VRHFQVSSQIDNSFAKRNTSEVNGSSHTNSIERSRNSNKAGGAHIFSSLKKQLSQDCETIFAHIQKKQKQESQENRGKTKSMNEQLKKSRSQSKERSFSPYLQKPKESSINRNLLSSFNRGVPN
jgi:hypothetical protein